MDHSRFYEVNLLVLTKAYHRLNIHLHSWPLLSKQKKIRGFQKCKVHCCNFKGFKVTNLQSLASPGFEPGTPKGVTYHRKTSSSDQRLLHFPLDSAELKVGDWEYLGGCINWCNSKFCWSKWMKLSRCIVYIITIISKSKNANLTLTWPPKRPWPRKLVNNGQI